MSWLEQVGYHALRREAKHALRNLAADVKAHITQEMETLMAEIARLKAAVDKELADDAAQNELIALLKAQLAEAQAAAADAAAGEADAEQRLAEALAAAVESAERLESNDPVVEEEPEEPVDPEPPVEEPVEPADPE